MLVILLVGAPGGRALPILRHAVAHYQDLYF